MPTLDEMYGDLAAADKAGDKDMATRIASSIRKTESLANPVGPPVPKPADVPDAPELTPEMVAAKAAPAPTPGQVQKEIDAATAGRKAKAAAQKEAVDSIRLRLPDALGGHDIPFVPQAVSKLLAGNAGQVADLPLAIRQSAANTFGIGDKEAITREIAQKAAADQPLKDDRWGGMGFVGGRMVPEIAAMYTGMPLLQGAGDAVKAAPFLPKFISQPASQVVKYGTPGAIFNQGNPDAKDPDSGFGSKGLWGTAQNLGGEAVGRVASRVIQPITSAVGELAASGVKGLRESPMGERVKLVAANLTDKPWVKEVTDTLAKLPGWGGKISKVDKEYNKAWTSEASARTGTRFDVPTTENMDRMWKNLNDTGNSFRTETPVKVGEIPKALQPTIDSLRTHMEITGQTGLLAKFEKALGGLKDTPASGTRTAADIAAGKDLPTPAAAKELTANDLMDLRRTISDKVQSAERDMRAPLIALRDKLDEAIRKAHPQPPPPGAVFSAKNPGVPLHPVTGEPLPPQQHPFDKWREQWGNAEDFGVAVKNMDSKLGTANPKDFPLSERGSQGAPGASWGSPEKKAFEKMTLDAQRQALTIPEGQNRSAWSRMLVGAGPIVGPAGSLLTAGMGPALANKLLATEGGGKYLTGQLRGQKELAELLLNAGRAGGATYGNTR